VRPEPPPPPPVIAADAPDVATLLPNGLRITFGVDRSDLNTGADEALRTLVQATAKPGTTYTILSFAAGTPDDASISRRLSLARALTVRSALINSGIASERIYVKALGAGAPATADGPADRADIVVGSIPQASAEVPSQSKPTP
jgi:outer membrane protein OmpA-like peptidoglycan-associated protein